jgi:hypothetical protein
LRAVTISLHQVSPEVLHLDIFIEDQGFLLTYQTESNVWEELFLEKIVCCERVADHRLVYLSYEGSLSKNRGNVRILWRGFTEENIEWKKKIRIYIKQAILYIID